MTEQKEDYDWYVRPPVEFVNRGFIKKSKKETMGNGEITLSSSLFTIYFHFFLEDMRKLLSGEIEELPVFLVEAKDAEDPNNAEG